MTIRIYSPVFPYPANDGASLVIFEQVRALIDLGHQVELAYWKSSVSAERHSQFQNQMAHPQKLTFRFFPGEDFSNSSLLRKISRAISSFLTSTASGEEYFYSERCRPIESLPVVDLEIYHYSFSYNWLKHSKAPASRHTAIYLHNHESDLYELRAQQTHDPLKRLFFKRNTQLLREHEAVISEMVDELWFVSPTDLRHFETRFGPPMATLRLVPPVFSKRLRTTRDSNHQQFRKSQVPVRVGLLGALDFLPNVDSAKWVLEKLAPELSDFRGELLIVGKHPSKNLKSRTQKFPFVSMLGYVEDIEDYYASLSFSLVPHISGSGVRIKLLESLASGVPALVNSRAAALLHPDLQKSSLLFISDDPSAWAQKILAEAQPFQSRDQAPSYETLQGLSGKQIYEFLENFSEHSVTIENRI